MKCKKDTPLWRRACPVPQCVILDRNCNHAHQVWGSAGRTGTTIPEGEDKETSEDTAGKKNSKTEEAGSFESL